MERKYLLSRGQRMEYMSLQSSIFSEFKNTYLFLTLAFLILDLQILKIYTLVLVLDVSRGPAIDAIGFSLLKHDTRLHPCSRGTI
jgi:hypothetical protein